MSSEMEDEIAALLANSLPLEADVFWRAGDDLSALAPPPPPGLPSALERLGPSPFPKSRFPFLGFLATVYDHVAAQVAAPPVTQPPSGATD
jgi:hypothetical protein